MQRFHSFCVTGKINGAKEAFLFFVLSLLFLFFCSCNHLSSTHEYTKMKQITYQWLLSLVLVKPISYYYLCLANKNKINCIFKHYEMGGCWLNVKQGLNLHYFISYSGLSVASVLVNRPYILSVINERLLWDSWGGCLYMFISPFSLYSISKK